MLITLQCRFHRYSSPNKKTCFQEHPNTNPDTEHPKRPPHPLSHPTLHPTHSTTKHQRQPPNTRPSTQHRTTEPPDTPTPDPTAQHPNSPTPNPSCGVAKHHDSKEEEAKQPHPTEEKGKPHPKEGKEGTTTEKKREQRNSTQKKEARQHRPSEDNGKVAPPSTPPKGGASKAARVCWNVDVTRTPKSMKVQPYVQPEMLKLCQRESIFASDQHGCSLARRDDALSAGPPGKRFSMNQQQQTIICATPVDQVKEMERLTAAANCVRYFEIAKKPNKFQKSIPKSEALISKIIF